MGGEMGDLIVQMSELFVIDGFDQRIPVEIGK
jgi:hypothetical protein